MEKCADCGELIEEFHAAWVMGGHPPRVFHSGCGDPFGLKSKVAELEAARDQISHLKAAVFDMAEWATAAFRGDMDEATP